MLSTVFRHVQGLVGTPAEFTSYPNATALAEDGTVPVVVKSRFTPAGQGEYRRPVVLGPGVRNTGDWESRRYASEATLAASKQRALDATYASTPNFQVFTRANRRVVSGSHTVAAQAGRRETARSIPRAPIVPADNDARFRASVLPAYPGSTRAYSQARQAIWNKPKRTNVPFTLDLGAAKKALEREHRGSANTLLIKAAPTFF